MVSYLFEDGLVLKVRSVTLACCQFWIIYWRTTHLNIPVLDHTEKKHALQISYKNMTWNLLKPQLSHIDIEFKEIY
jgi:hypothetical protein